MGAHRPDPLFISVTLMIWTTGEVIGRGKPPTMASMMQPSSCHCMKPLPELLSEPHRRPVQGKIHDKDDESPRRDVDSL